MYFAVSGQFGAWFKLFSDVEKCVIQLQIFQDSDELSGKYMGTREKEERADRDRGPGKDKERGFREREKERKRSREEPTRGRNIQGTD